MDEPPEFTCVDRVVQSMIFRVNRDAREMRSCWTPSFSEIFWIMPLGLFNSIPVVLMEYKISHWMSNSVILY